MTQPRRGLALITFLVMSIPVAPSGQEPGTVVESDPRVRGLSYEFAETGEEIPYALFVPIGYDTSREWPLIVALHGLGRPYDWMMGYESFIDFAERDGYIVVSPLGS